MKRRQNKGGSRKFDIPIGIVRRVNEIAARVKRRRGWRLRRLRPTGLPQQDPEDD